MPQESKKENIAAIGQIRPREIVKEMKESYIDYAMSVIVARALPDVRDGLKPVHRRILYAMNEMGLAHNARFRKSAAVTGEVLGKYHPHGDASVYDATVRMAQDFSLRYPLVSGQGNFGCFTADTKIKLIDNRNLSFEELIKEYRQGKKNFTFTIGDDRKIKIAEIKNPRKTRENAEIMKVVLDNGEEIKCTLNHKFMLKNGPYKEAKDLKMGDSLMPLYSKLSTEKDNPNAVGYNMVFQPGLNLWDFVHVISDNWNIENNIYKTSNGKIRHHIVDSNKRRVTNLTGKKKFVNICRYLQKHGFLLNKENFEKTRKEIFGTKSFTSWDLGIEKYYGGNNELVLFELNRNHKVNRTELLKESADVYDLTIDETHNFALASGVFVHNSIDGDPPAAQRYTECKLSKIGEEMLKDVEKETVDFMDNYDGTKQEPKVLPSPLPQLLLNGSFGIAVGMATNIPPHNLSEICDALVYLIDKPKANTEDLFSFIQGPDFPTGGAIFGKKDIISAYSQGRGSIDIRGKAEIIEDEKTGKTQIIITEIPYEVQKSSLVEKFAELVQEKRIEGIKDIRDESDKDGMRIVFDLQKGSYPQKILNCLYKFSDLQKAFYLNMLALIDGIQPRVLSLAELLSYFLKHRKEVVFRKAKFDLGKAKERAHILEGLHKCLDRIDAVIQTIKKSKNREDAQKNLMLKFKLTEIQANAILETKLAALAKLERERIEQELKELQAKIKELEAVIKSPKKIEEIVKKEIKELKDNFGDERKTKVYNQPIGEIAEEDLVPQEETIITLTQGGYIKRINPETYKIQKRGGKGILGMKTLQEDIVEHFLCAQTHDSLLFFTDSGKVFRIVAYEIPEGQRVARGRGLLNFLELSAEEKVLSIITLGKEDIEAGVKSLVMITKNGIIKKTALEEFRNVRSNGLIAIKLRKGDSLKKVVKSAGQEEIIIATRKGQSIKFEEKEIREMGRTASGIRGIRLKKDDEVIGGGVIRPAEGKAENYLLVVAKNGYGKRTDIKEYRLQGRGGSGIKTANITPKTGDLVASAVLTGAEEDLIVISQKGNVIRINVSSIPKISRSTQGVRIIRLAEGDKVASATCI